MFREGSQNKIFQDIVQQVQDAIFDGSLKNGDVLHPERDLKEMFNTSRVILREAPRVLEWWGLITCAILSPRLKVVWRTIHGCWFKGTTCGSTST